MADNSAGTSRSRASGAVAPQPARPRSSGTISFGPYRLSANLRLLERDGVAVHLRDRAFDILCVLTEHAGEIVSNRELIARVWGKVVVEEGSVRFHINGLRKALARDGAKTQYIRNVAGRGYTFTAPVRGLALDPAGDAVPQEEIKAMAGLLSQFRFICDRVLEALEATT